MLFNPRWFAGALMIAGVCAPHLASARPGPPDAAPPPAASEGGAHLEGTSAGAEIRAGAGGASFTPITVDVALPSRFELRTADEGLRLVLADGTRVDLAPHTRLVRLAPVDVALTGAAKVAADHLSMAAGEVVVEAPATARAGATLLSSHDVLVATLPGALLRAHARAPRGAPGGAPPTALAVAVYQGEARFLTQGAWKPLLAGHAVEAIGLLPAAAPVPLPDGPTWSAAAGPCVLASPTRPAGDCSLGLALSQDAAPLSLGWAETPRAIGYLLEIARDAAFQDVVTTRETSETAATVPLLVGRYFARVRAHGVELLPGLPGATRAVRVARLDLPAGTRTPDGAWLLPRERCVEIGEPAGLELAVGRTGFWKAPACFGLTREEPYSTCYLRIAGAPDFVALTLRPSPLRAVVRLTPRNPVWPADTINVAVRVDDDAGPLSPGFEPKLLVQVNAGDVPVVWSRRDNIWEASLRPRVPPGPWVVHVEARDTHGNTLGDAFVEVSGPPQPTASTRP